MQREGQFGRRKSPCEGPEVQSGLALFTPSKGLRSLRESTEYCRMGSLGSRLRE